MALPRLRTLQQAVKDEQELEEKVAGGKRVGDGIETAAWKMSNSMF